MRTTIRLHDTRTGQVLPVEPNAEGVVRMYACGPTVYGRIHVGNARPYVVFSLLARLFVHEGYKVTFVANITDVNDKIYNAALAAGVGSEQLARDMVQAYVTDTDRLELGRPDYEPKASETIAEIVELIERLIEGGHAYPAAPRASRSAAPATGTASPSAGVSLRRGEARLARAAGS